MIDQGNEEARDSLAIDIEGLGRVSVTQIDLAIVRAIESPL